MADYKLKVQKRNIVGRKVKGLRQKGLLPANIFGRNIKSQAVSFDQKDFEKIFTQAGETSIIKLLLAKEERPVLVSNIQKDPVTGEPLHVDFKQVDLKTKVSASIPVKLIGESPAEKSGLGVVVQQIDEVEVEALPTDLPEHFEVDISSLSEVRQSILVENLKFDRNKVKIENMPDQTIVSVEALREEEERPVEPKPESKAEEVAEPKTVEESS